MKRLLEGYVDGNLTPVQKWTVEEQKEISDILVRTSLPVEIHRVMRSLKYLKYWKGSELRTFLNHISIPLLRGRIHDNEYRHFRLLYVGETMYKHSGPFQPYLPIPLKGNYNLLKG
uniref:Uncharacterized protein n=1 Tax=Anopheles funestus TaxID=62324 RepID=A0A182RIF7_ANOFN